jgi:hypothetical protein
VQYEQEDIKQVVTGSMEDLINWTGRKYRNAISQKDKGNFHEAKRHFYGIVNAINIKVKRNSLELKSLPDDLVEILFWGYLGSMETIAYTSPPGLATFAARRYIGAAQQMIATLGSAKWKTVFDTWLADAHITDGLADYYKKQKNDINENYPHSSKHRDRRYEYHFKKVLNLTEPLLEVPDEDIAFVVLRDRLMILSLRAQAHSHTLVEEFRRAEQFIYRENAPKAGNLLAVIDAMLRIAAILPETESANPEKYFRLAEDQIYSELGLHDNDIASLRKIEVLMGRYASIAIAKRHHDGTMFSHGVDIEGGKDLIHQIHAVLPMDGLSYFEDEILMSGSLLNSPKRSA